MRNHATNRGFTLIELLIVVSLLVLLTGVVVFVLNPVEMLRRSRDAQRLSDLATLKNALGLYITSTSTIYLAGALSNDGCRSGAYTSGDKIYYSHPSDSPGSAITDSTLDGGSGSVPSAAQAAQTSLRGVGGSGWLPVNLASIQGGSPISHLPVDPANTIDNAAAISASDHIYRYACDSSDLTFEINANLESSTYTSLDNRETADGGNNGALHEVGTKLTILGAGTDF